MSKFVFFIDKKVLKTQIYRESLQQMLHQNQRVVDNPVYLCDLGASLSAADPPELQAIMEEMDVPKRLMLALSLLKKELEVFSNNILIYFKFC